MRVFPQFRWPSGDPHPGVDFPTPLRRSIQAASPRTHQGPGRLSPSVPGSAPSIPTQDPYLGSQTRIRKALSAGGRTPAPDRSGC